MIKGGQGKGGGRQAKELRGPGCCEVQGQDSNDVTPVKAKFCRFGWGHARSDHVSKGSSSLPGCTRTRGEAG